MTLTQIQNAIAARFDYSGTSFSSVSSEWTRRLVLINQAEDTWKRFMEGKWECLFVPNTLTTTASQSYVTLPSDYEKGAGIVTIDGMININNMLYKLVQKSETLNYDTNSNFAWITGNKVDGYKLNIQPTPNGAYTFNFDYYTNLLAKKSDDTYLEFLTNPDDKTKIPDPYFIVDWVIGELYLIDDEPQTKYQPFKDSAEKRLVNMATAEGREENQIVEVKVVSEESGYDTFNSNDSD